MSDTETADDAFERKLATILSADVAAYSRLMAEDEEGTLQTFRGHKEVFGKLVASHRGRVFSTAGDAILAEFGSAVEAVRCATEIQSVLRTRNDKLRQHRRVEFRIGVNLGDVLVEGADLLGDGVNLAARLQEAAAPGGICIADSVYDQIRNKLSLSFTPLGEVNYKNIPQPVRTFAIAGADGLGRLPAPPPPRRATSSVRRFRRVIVAVLLIIAVSAAIWGHSSRRQHRAELRAAVANIEHPAVALGPNAATQQPPATVTPRPTIPGPNRTDTRAAESSPDKTGSSTAPEPLSPPAAPSEVSQNAVARANPDSAGDRAGIYGGQICYGPSEGEPALCFHAQAVVINRRISGEWSGREQGATLYLEGEVRRSGKVTIHMRSERADGSRFAASDLVGTLRDGKLDAIGAFHNGRSVTLNWRKN